MGHILARLADRKLSLRRIGKAFPVTHFQRIFHGLFDLRLRKHTLPDHQLIGFFSRRQIQIPVRVIHINLAGKLKLFAQDLLFPEYIMAVRSKDERPLILFVETQHLCVMLRLHLIVVELHLKPEVLAEYLGQLTRKPFAFRVLQNAANTGRRTKEVPVVKLR